MPNILLLYYFCTLYKLVYFFLNVKVISFIPTFANHLPQILAFDITLSLPIRMQYGLAFTLL